jgi:hypothetical protein
MTKAQHKPNIVSLKLTDIRNGLIRVTFDREVKDPFGFAVVTIKAGDGYYLYADDELKAYAIVQAKIDNGDIA